MRRVLVTIALSLFMTRPLIPTDVCEVYKAIERQRFIEEEGLVRIKISCYIAPAGARTADGSVPVEGYCSGNKEHLGQDLILYDKNLIPVGRYEIRDVGGHKLLRNGEAIDFYRDSLERCYSFVADHGSYAYIKYVERGEEVDGITSNTGE